MEATMTSTDVSGTTSAEMPAPATADLNLEVVTLNVTDIDRAKGFYQSLGWRLDADFAIGDDFRIVQFTPPHSQCSIHFGKGLTTTGPGGPIRLILAVADIDAARADLISHGADVSDVYHYERQPGRSGELESRVAGPDPDTARSYSNYASFSDPDGNVWLLQEITTRLPGRVDAGATSYP
jgi:catechol 2,3-dioxygenase-like lactoylglutathione lyase family enzyme